MNATKKAPTISRAQLDAVNATRGAAEILWTRVDAATIKITHEGGSSCTVSRGEECRGWVVLNEGEPINGERGPRWPHYYESFKGLLAAVAR